MTQLSQLSPACIAVRPHPWPLRPCFNAWRGVQPQLASSLALKGLGNDSASVRGRLSSYSPCTTLLG